MAHNLWVIICFYSYNGKTYTDHPDTVNDHYRTSLGNLKNNVVAVGGLLTKNNKVEIFDINSNTWDSKIMFQPSFPFCSSS